MECKCVGEYAVAAACDAAPSPESVIGRQYVLSIEWRSSSSVRALC